MSLPNASPYSQQETVEGMLAFYRQLVNLTYPDESVLKIPPTGGWSISQMHPDALQGKTDTVKDLVRQLPYLCGEPEGRGGFRPTILIAWQTSPICYLFDSDASAEMSYPLPAHCLHLTDHVTREGYQLILDTERGTITEATIWGTLPPKPEMWYEQYNQLPHEDKWRAFPTLPIRDFFQYWIRLYSRLVWMLVPVPDRHRAQPAGRFYCRESLPIRERWLAEEVGPLEEWHPDVSSDPDYGRLHTLHTAAVYNTHLRHGWPSSFDKDACKAALSILEERFEEETRRLTDEANRLAEAEV